MIHVLHFTESMKDLPSDWESSLPNLKEGAEKYRDFLIQEEKSWKDFNSIPENKKRLYMKRFYPITEGFTITERFNDSFKSKSHKLICLEYVLGEQMFRDWKCNTPEVQEAMNKSKVAGADWFKQFESNPDGAVDYLDNLKDRTNYSKEFEKIEIGKKVGKYEN